MDTNTPHWYAPLETILSLGSQADRPGSLARLHEARKSHLAQFFTPEALVGLIWRIASPAFNRATADGFQVALLDNSVGSGRMFWPADPALHQLYGCDLHAPSLTAVGDAAQAAGFGCSFEVAGMESARPQNMSACLLNPPYSIHLESPTLEAFPCTTWGRYGPNTSAMSHTYAVHQALDAADIVLAVLPTTYAEEIATDPSMTRLRAIVRLPRGAFREEGTEVSTCVVIFDSTPPPRVDRFDLASLEESIPDLSLTCRSTRKIGNPKLKILGIHDDGPAITLPVTGDNRVNVAHDGRWIKLKFFCGLTQARVLNAVMVDGIEAHRPPDHRYPKGVKYIGQGKLDIEVHLAQHDPETSFNTFLNTISDAGGSAVVDAGLRGYLSRRIRQSARERTPFAHTINVPEGWAGSGDTLTGTARQRFLANPGVWGSPVIQAGASIEFRALDDGRFGYKAGQMDITVSADELHQRFNVVEGKAISGWCTVHKGLLEAFPEQAKALRARAIALGLDSWLSWGFQLDDTIELTLKRSGIAALEMGLGKARIAVGLILLSGCHRGLICVESQLIPEIVRECKGLPIAPDSWKVIRSASDLDALTQINIISYERLRGRADLKGSHHTYARRLRRRFGIVVADEGHLMSNADSAQTQAVWNLSAKRRYILTGTPAANYPRCIMPLLAFVGGDGTHSQPYGYRRGYMEENWRQSMSQAERGISKFCDDFVSLEWVTNEFAETLSAGAKREIPKLANVDKYRATLAPWVKRRVSEEPAVALHISIPRPTKKVLEIPWDAGHLAHYLATAEDFMSFYRNAHKNKGKAANLIALLARIQAVQFAANCPQQEGKNRRIYMPITSKQRFAVDRLVTLADEGHKTLLFADNPRVLELLATQLTQQTGIAPVVFHGERSINDRTREMDERFRFSNQSPWMLATLGCAQTGLNLWQADTAVFYNRSWSAKTEDQALARLLRPQQTRDVTAEYWHLPGSIDTYQAQMVAAKSDAIRSGIDWATPELADTEFVHLDTLLGRFVEDLAGKMGVKRHKLRSVVSSFQPKEQLCLDLIAA